MGKFVSRWPKTTLPHILGFDPFHGSLGPLCFVTDRYRFFQEVFFTPLCPHDRPSLPLFQSFFATEFWPKFSNLFCYWFLTKIFVTGFWTKFLWLIFDQIFKVFVTDFRLKVFKGARTYFVSTCALYENYCFFPWFYYHWHRGNSGLLKPRRPRH